MISEVSLLHLLFCSNLALNRSIASILQKLLNYWGRVRYNDSHTSELFIETEVNEQAAENFRHHWYDYSWNHDREQENSQCCIAGFIIASISSIFDDKEANQTWYSDTN